MQPLLNTVWSAGEYVLGLAGLVFLLLIFMWLRRKLVALLTRKSTKLHLQTDKEIQEILVELRVCSGADRVGVFMFHNGDRYINGSSMLRVSCSHESISRGITSFQAQGVLCSNIADAFDFLEVKKPKSALHFKCVEHMEVGLYRSTLEAQGVKAVVKFPLYRGGDIIGYVCADMVHTDCPDMEKMEVLKERAALLELYVNRRHKKMFLLDLLEGAL